MTTEQLDADGPIRGGGTTLAEIFAEDFTLGDFSPPAEWSESIKAIPPTRSDKHLAARRYAAMGYPVFPCVPGTKVPTARSRGYKDATTDLAQVNRWWRENPQYNIGIATAGFFVLDIDGPDHEWLGRVGEHVNECSQSRTPGGGMHYWFLDAKKRFRISVGRLAEHVDTRAGGGYACVAPSVVDGNPYRWMPGYELGEPDELPEVPDSLADAIEAAKPSSAPSVAAPESPIPDGQRNATLARLGGGMRRMGMGEPEIRAALRAANQSRCNPPLDEREVDKVAWSVSRYEPDQCSQAIVEGWADGLIGGPDADELAELRADAPADPGDFPAELLDVPGFLGDVIEFYLATAFRHQPVLALSSAIPLMGVLAGRKVRDKRDTRTNIYCVGVAPSGEGKEHGRQVNKRILSAAGLGNMAGPESFGSHVGIITTLEDQPATLFQLDEFGRYLAGTNNIGQSIHQYKTIDVLLKMYSSANSMFVGDAYADRNKVKRVDQPHMCINGTTVAKSLFESITSDSIDNGLMGRILMFPGDPEPDTLPGNYAKVPDGVVAFAKAWGAWIPGGNLSDTSIGCDPLMIDYDDDAQSLYDEWGVEFTARARADQEGYGVIWTRCQQKMGMLALIYTASRFNPDPVLQRPAPTVTRKAIEWSAGLVDFLTRWMLAKLDGEVADNEYDRKVKYLVGRVKKLSGNGRKSVSTATVRNSKPLRNIPNRDWESLVQTAVATGQIIEDEPSKNGGKRWNIPS